MINRSTLDQFRKSTGFGQSNLRNTNERSNDMAIWNYDNPAASNPGYGGGGLLQTQGGWNYSPGESGLVETQPPAYSDNATPMPKTPMGNPTIRGVGQGGMSAPQFSSTYQQFQSSGAPSGMSFADWMRSGRFVRPRNLFPSSAGGSPIRNNPYQTDPYTGGGTDIKPKPVFNTGTSDVAPGVKPWMINPPGNSGVTRPPKTAYVSPVFNTMGGGF